MRIAWEWLDRKPVMGNVSARTGSVSDPLMVSMLRHATPVWAGLDERRAPVLAK